MEPAGLGSTHKIDQPHRLSPKVSTQSAGSTQQVVLVGQRPEEISLNPVPESRDSVEPISQEVQVSNSESPQLPRKSEDGCLRCNFEYSKYFNFFVFGSQVYLLSMIELSISRVRNGLGKLFYT